MAIKNYRQPDTIDFYLKDIYRNMHYGIDKHLKDYDVTNVQGRLLGMIYGANRHGIKITRKYLEEKTGISGPSVTSLLDSLERKGYIKRSVNDEDARALSITVTEPGETLINKIHGIFRASEAKVTEGMTSEEKKTFKTLLKKAHRNITDKNK